VLLLKQIIQKQDEIVIINDSLYWKNAVCTGVSHENRYIVTAAAVYYPPSKDLLHRNTSAYPVKQIREALMSKHSHRDWEDFYQIPERLKVDVLDEGLFDGLNALNDALELLSQKLNSTNVCTLGEADFARMKYLCSPIEGDKALFEGLASGALAEDRIQMSASCKRLLSKDQMALTTLGMAIIAIEKADPYRSVRSGSRDYGSEGSLGASYS
jgi:hypothetical protein